ncbi:MAG: hypothetical protein ACK5NG_05435, partial [Chthoniobacterales bacterium]
FDSNLTGTFNNYGTVADPNYFLNNLNYNGINLVNTSTPPYTPYWSQWVSGGKAGFPTGSPVAEGSWSFGSGLSAPWRELAPGSWDGFVFGDGLSSPSIAPVPEPTVIYFLGGAAILFYLKRRLHPC